MAQPHEVRMGRACDDQVGGSANSGLGNRIGPRAVAQEGAPLADAAMSPTISHAPVQADGARV